ncbi:hypothetical protein [Desulfofustis glycolicus]|uniref:hypothetical protein n=1 Tax=Desulfofustis glycolicus TaxID=51195 RepID=UPI0011610865|nr:hypothetical protein [Desulfofustis glycolicus]MCB2217856.1 hypothetical protein [Desulfobulbaceae bacterium]
MGEKIVLQMAQQKKQRGQFRSKFMPPDSCVPTGNGGECGDYLECLGIREIHEQAAVDFSALGMFFN